MQCLFVSLRDQPIISVTRGRVNFGAMKSFGAISGAMNGWEVFRALKGAMKYFGLALEATKPFGVSERSSPPTSVYVTNFKKSKKLFLRGKFKMLYRKTSCVNFFKKNSMVYWGQKSSS